MSDDFADATPEPWIVVTKLSGSENDRGWIIAGGGRRIAEVWPMNNMLGEHSPEAAANANLLGAAPRLLRERDALRDALEKYSDHLPRCRIHLPSYPPCDCGLDAALNEEQP